MKITVKTPARLHLGMIPPAQGLSRIFGSIGLAIERPNVHLEVSEAEVLEVRAENALDVKNIATLFLNSQGLEPHAHIEVKSTIPKHVGLGSQTQLVLAIGGALAKLHNLEIGFEELAFTMGRGMRSRIGIEVFNRGGFLADAGLDFDLKKAERKYLPPLIFHHNFPSDWYFVIATPSVHQRITDDAEKYFFNQLPLIESEVVERISYHFLFEIFPSLIEKNISLFGRALTELQYLIGEGYQPVQGGIFSTSLTDELAAYMQKHGAVGVGQSSWGPTIYGLVGSEMDAIYLKNLVSNFLVGNNGGEVFSTCANNTGALISIEES